MQSCIYEGRVRHARFEAVRHGFEYGLFLVYLDLAELPRVFRGRWLWSTHRPALARFRREDHLGDPRRPLAETVAELVERHGGPRPRGPIRLLTNLRYWGYVFNPVSLYYCFAPDGEHVESIVADVSNTPWNERHQYVLVSDGGSLRFRTPKRFHVSPFLDMDMDYRWHFEAPGERLRVGIENRRGPERLFSASLDLRRREIDGPALAGVLARHPFMTARTIAGIYWQAFRLRRKRAPWYPHPRERGEPMEMTLR